MPVLTLDDGLHGDRMGAGEFYQAVDGGVIEFFGLVGRNIPGMPVAAIELFKIKVFLELMRGVADPAIMVNVGIDRLYL